MYRLGLVGEFDLTRQRERVEGYAHFSTVCIRSVDDAVQGQPSPASKVVVDDTRSRQLNSEHIHVPDAPSWNYWKESSK